VFDFVHDVVANDPGAAHADDDVAFSGDHDMTKAAEADDVMAFVAPAELVGEVVFEGEGAFAVKLFDTVDDRCWKFFFFAYLGDFFENGFGHAITGFDFFLRRAAVVAHVEITNERRQGEALENERGEDDAEGEKLDEVDAGIGKIGITFEGKGGGERDNAAHAGPADDEDLAPVGEDFVFPNAFTNPEGDVGAGENPADADKNAGDVDDESVK